MCVCVCVCVYWIILLVYILRKRKGSRWYYTCLTITKKDLLNNSVLRILNILNALNHRVTRGLKSKRKMLSYCNLKQWSHSSSKCIDQKKRKDFFVLFCFVFCHIHGVLKSSGQGSNPLQSRPTSQLWQHCILYLLHHKGTSWKDFHKHSHLTGPFQVEIKSWILCERRMQVI